MIDIFNEAYVSVMSRALHAYLSQLTIAESTELYDEEEIKKVEMMIAALRHLPELMKAFR